MLTISQIAVWDLEIKVGRLCFVKTGTVGTDMEEVPKWPTKMVTIAGLQGSPFCFLRDTIYVIRYLANVPLRRLVAVKRGAKVPRGPLLAGGGICQNFHSSGRLMPPSTRFSQRACWGPPRALGATKERNMPDEEGEACPMPRDFLTLAKALRRIAATK